MPVAIEGAGFKDQGFEGPFSTAHFVQTYRDRYPQEWKTLEDTYGFGGKGAGQHWTAYTQVARQLGRRARRGELQKLDYRPSPDWWGSPVVRFWSTPTSSGAGGNPGEEVDLEYREGTVRLRIHLQKERARGLAKKKKADFIKQHGRIFCERCKIDPQQVYGPEFGASVMEVHHAKVAVGEMSEGHKTKMSDLQCLCANCHRLTHAESWTKQ